MTDDNSQPQVVADTRRIPVIDLARGFAILGILVINVTTMAGPGLASATPDWHGHAGAHDWASFTVTWLFFEGKMRALFATLFGVSLALFLSRGDEGARIVEQVRRLLWLAIFGYLHFALFWWGDILFTYAIAGMIALLFKDLPPSRLFIMGIGAYMFVSFAAAGQVWSTLVAAHAVHAGTASEMEAGFVAQNAAFFAERSGMKMAEYALPFWQAVQYRMTVMPSYPFTLASEAVFEALPLMLCGMALARSGFFTGAWPRKWLMLMAIVGAALGLGWYGAMLAYEASQGFGIVAASLLPYRIGLIGRFLMTASYLALIALFGAYLVRGWLGQRIAAAGRLAFSNYLGSTVVMTFLLHGWGLGLAAREYGHTALMAFVLLGWALILGWSKPWLARFGIGPLEWLWRMLAGVGIRKARTAS